MPNPSELARTDPSCACASRAPTYPDGRDTVHLPGCPWFEVERLAKERDKLQAFKDFVHAYLDGKGVPHHPPGTHGAEGCRVGDRLDWWRDVMRAAVAERDRLHTACGAALALLTELEAAGPDRNYDDCPECGEYLGHLGKRDPAGGHDPECRFPAVLSMLRQAMEGKP